MTTQKTISPKSAFHPVKHLNVRLQKFRSLKTSALQSPRMVPAAMRASKAKPSVKSIVPYGLVIASLVLSGVTASTARAAAVDAEAAGPARVIPHRVIPHRVIPHHVITHHVVTRHVSHIAKHVVRQHAAPMQQIDPVAQFFQGLFGIAPVVRAVRGRVDEDDVPDSPTYDTATPVGSSDDAQAASDAEVQAIQQLDDENALNASMQAAQEQNDEANAATLQTEINAGM